MNIKSIEVEGFFSFKHKQKFVFDNETIYIVTGRNGSGKSSFFVESLLVCLYNSLYKDMKMNDIISDGSDFCRIVIETDNGVIQRKRGKVNSFTFDNKPINFEDLNLPSLDIFLHSVIFGQDFKGFVFYKDVEKKKFITQLSLGSVDQKIAKVEEVIKSDKIKMQGYLDEKERIDSVIAGLNWDMINAQYNDWEMQNTQERAILQQEIDDYEEKVKVSKEKVDTIDKDIEVIQKSIKQVKQDISDVENSITTLNFQRQGNASEQTRLQNEIKKLTQKIEMLDSIVQCPTCLSVLTPEHKAKVGSQFEKEIQKLQQEKQELAKLNEGTQVGIDNLRQKKSGLVKELDEIETKLSFLNDNHAQASEQLYKNKYMLAQLYKKVDELETNPYAQIREKVYKKLSELEKQQEQNEKLIDLYTVRQQACSFWLVTLKEFRSKLFSDVLGMIEPVANDFLRFLSDGVLGVKINTNVKATQSRVLDKFDIDIYYNNRKVDFNRLSGGEKKQVSVAINFSLVTLTHLQYAYEWNLLILDEIFDGLDGFAKDKVIGLLQMLLKMTKKTIILITHDDIDAVRGGDFRNLEVIKDGQGQSKILYR